MSLPQLNEAPDPGPLWLAPAYFLAALLWLGLTALGLLIVGPDLRDGLLYQPRVFAVTHALTLGVIGSAIFGALHQFVPAVLGVGPRHPRAGAAGFSLFQLGLVILVTGFWHWRPLWLGIGWAVVLGGIGGAAWNTLPARRRAARNRYVGWYITLGHSALGLAALIAGLRIGDGLGWWQTSREGLLAAHLHLGLVGFGTMTAVGFGSKMLPAFLGVHDPSTRPLTWIGWLGGAGLLLFTLGQAFGVAAATLAGGALMLSAGLAHLILLADYFGRRTRPLDPGLGFVLAAAVGYAGALTVGAALLALRPPPGPLWAAYGLLALLGWLTLLIVGVMHRVVPRVLTLLRVRKGGRLTPLAQRVELVSSRLGWGSLGLMAPSIAGLAFSVAMGWEAGTRATTVCFAAGTALLYWQAIRVARQALGPAGARD